MSQYERITWMYHKVLEKNGRFTREDVMERFEISEATFKRDVELLRNYYNLPITWDSQLKYYTLDCSQNEVKRIPLPEVWFTQDELMALMMSYRVLASVKFENKTEAIEKLKDRIKVLLGRDEILNEALHRIEVTRFGARRMMVPSLKDFVEAVLFRKRMRIDYHARHKNQTTSRDVSPQRLIYHRDNWYLVSWCHLKNELRSFSVDRILRHECLDEEAFEVDVQALNRELGSGYGIYSGTHIKTAHLKFGEVSARWVADQEWHAEQEGWFENGVYHLQVPYSDERELVGEILRFGGDVEVVAPVELKERVRRVAQHVLESY